MTHEASRRGLLLLAAGLVLGACAGTTRHGAPSHYRFDSATSACRQRPALCVRKPGEEPVLPLHRPAQAMATAGTAGRAAQFVLEASTQARIQKVLEECADSARSEVLLRRMGDRSPTPQECLEKVGVDAQGQPVTRAMQWGNEMHRVALECARERLGHLYPGGFSLEQRYRYDTQRDTTTLVSPEEAQRLLRQGGGGLRGTFVPDVVVHSGDPLRAQLVYDFKFPCNIQGGVSPWRQYPEGHPFEEYNQGELYRKALRADTWRIAPRWGTIR